MPIARMDHFTILTTDAVKTIAFYRDTLGLEPGPRPAFSFPGAWLYNDGARGRKAGHSRWRRSP